MHRTLILLFFTLLFTLGSHSSLMAAWPWKEKPLVTINSIGYTSEDFSNWWELWKDPDTPFPETMDPYIEWNLLLHEANAMGLYQEPSYRKKVDVYLKVRAQFALKNEEVDSKTFITDEAMWQRYEKDYTPQWQVAFLIFSDEEKAKETYEKLKSGELQLDRIADDPAKADVMQFQQNRVLRPAKTLDSWLEILLGMAPGDFAPPVSMGNVFTVIKLEDVTGPSQEDFEAFREKIRSQLWKEEQSRLTSFLLDNLRKKYEIHIDEELIAEIDLEKPYDHLLGKPVVTSKGEPFINSDGFIKQYEQSLKMTPDKLLQEDDSLAKMKTNIINNLVTSELIALESLSRGYEKKPPLKKNYDFYRQYRLVKEIEKRLFQARNATQDEIISYYEQNKKEFTFPEIVSIAIIKAEAGIAGKIHDEIKNGEDFFTAARKYLTEEIPVKDVPFDHLDPAIKEVIRKLSKGEVSAPITEHDSVAIVKLIGRKKDLARPLESVQAGIAKMLKQRNYTQAKEEYLTKLKNVSRISANKSAWKKIQKKYGR